MQKLLSKHWHHLAANEIKTLLETDLSEGLDIFVIQHRQERFGVNQLAQRKRKSPIIRFLLQFNNPLIYVLLGSSLLTLLVKGPVDAGIILGVVLVNAIVGYIQESKAENAISALAQSMVVEATVIRSGKKQKIPATNLVPGDIVLLQSGDKVPADLRLFQTRELQIAEAVLTGESVSVQKNSTHSLAINTLLSERINMAYATTLVTFGQGKGIVIGTGENTEIGRISQLISEADSIETPLTRKFSEFSQLLLYALLGIAGLIFVIGLVRGNNLADTLTNSIALAVASIPEGLPAAVTVTLAIGVTRMARRKAIIRKLPAVEALGSTTIIGSDKTGTLTQNQMTVKEIFTNSTTYLVEGSGYDPSGKFLVGTNHPLESFPEPLQRVLIAGVLANDSHLILENGLWVIQGDPTEGALIVSAEKAGITESDLNKDFPRLESIPFESDYQYMATLHEDRHDEEKLAAVKGSVEAILARSEYVYLENGTIERINKEEINDTALRMSARGLRVLAFAEKRFPASQITLDHDELQDGLIFLGLQAMIDPSRPEAVEAVAVSQDAGIMVKMITGDHPLTASAIAHEVGIRQADQVLTGRELERIKDEALIEVVKETGVFARVTPEQKLRLVEAMQASGNIVAMTGDGVNDAPALKQADIGIAMGITGTDVSKEAADMVLTDDNFATIEAAVEEGRGIFDNLTKIISWTLPTNLGEGLVIFLAILLNEVLPILPVQVLWINMVTVALLGLVLALEPIEPGIMIRPPRNPNTPILTKYIIRRIIIVGILILIGAFGLFEVELLHGESVEIARTVAVNLVVFVEIFYLFSSRSLQKSIFQVGVFSNPLLWLGVVSMILLQLLFTYVPFMQRIFMSGPLDLNQWWRILGFGLFSLLVVEIEKWLTSRSK